MGLGQSGAFCYSMEILPNNLDLFTSFLSLSHGKHFISEFTASHRLKISQLVVLMGWGEKTKG